MGMYGGQPLTRLGPSGSRTHGRLGRLGSAQSPNSPRTLDGRKKACPRNAYPALCEAGAIRGTQPGQYGAPIPSKNGAYALAAYRVLQGSPALSTDKRTLREVAMPGVHDNQQIDIVVSLWNEGLLLKGDMHRAGINLGLSCVCSRFGQGYNPESSRQAFMKSTDLPTSWTLTGRKRKGCSGD